MKKLERKKEHVSTVLVLLPHMLGTKQHSILTMTITLSLSSYTGKLKMEMFFQNMTNRQNMVNTSTEIKQNKLSKTTG